MIRRDGFPARLLLYFLYFTSRLYSALPREMSIAEPPQDRKKLPQAPCNSGQTETCQEKIPGKKEKISIPGMAVKSTTDNHNRRHSRRLFVPRASPSDLSSLHLPDESTNFDTTEPALIYFSHSRFMTASAIFMPSTAADVIPPA